MSYDRTYKSVFLTEDVCLCLYIWCICICLNELWYEVLCCINLLIQCPSCTTRLNPVHQNTCFSKVELGQRLHCLISIISLFSIYVLFVKGSEKGKVVSTCVELLYKLNLDCRTPYIMMKYYLGLVRHRSKATNGIV